MKSFNEVWKLIVSFFLNLVSSRSLEWDPSWFGERKHSKKLASKVAKFQKSYGVKETGVVDESTIRRRVTEREALDIASEEFLKDRQSKESLGKIICNGRRLDIAWDKVVSYKNSNGMKLSQKNYKKHTTERKPTMFVAHWDVCLSSKSCFKILEKRGLSVHFLIDNDGTIYQIMDCNDVGYHAGSKKINNTSIGVEISNAYYPKYQTLYEKRGFGSRPILTDVEVHGKKLEPFTGFYPVQIQAFKALAQALHNAYDIPLVAPMENNKLVETIYSDAKNATFKGVVSHYHLTERKIDCAGLKLDEVLK